MRPNSIRKTPNIPKKSTPYEQRERLVLNQENDNREPIIPPKGPRFNLNKNKREGQEKTRNIYAQLSDIGKPSLPQQQQKQIKQKQPTTTQLKHKFKFTTRNHNKESIVFDQEKKEEVIVGELKREESVERVPEKPAVAMVAGESQGNDKSVLKLKPSLGRIKKLQKKIEEPQDAPDGHVAGNRSEQFEVSNTYENLSTSFRPQESQYQNNYSNPPPAYQPSPQKYQINIDDLEDRQINLTTEAKPVNLQKQQKQLQRIQKLRNLISLDLDMYEPMINLQSVTEYELYISKIKSNTVNNSQDQAFEDKVDKECQHSSGEMYDFSCQAPDDKKATYIRGLEFSGNSSVSLYGFVSKAATVIEELLRPSKSFSMPPIYLLSMNPQLIGLYNCPMPISLYKCNDLSLALFGQKLYVARGEITSLLSMGSLLLGGTNQGTILIWTGHTEKSSFFESVKLTLGNSDFQLPSTSSDYLQRQSYFKGSSRIVSLSQKINNQFYSLEQFGKLITWSIITKTDQYKISYLLQPLSYISLSSVYSDLNIICRGLWKDTSHQLEENRRNESYKPRYFITASKGIVKNVSEVGYPNYFNTGGNVVVDMLVTIRGGLIYAICQDRSLRVYNKSVTEPLLEVQVPSTSPLQSIHIPSILIQQGKQLELLAEIYIANTKGEVFRYNILENPNEPIEVIRQELTEDKNLLKASVGLNQDKLEWMFVTKELRTVYSEQICKANMAKNTQNFKRIIEQDKRVVEFLNGFS